MAKFYGYPGGTHIPVLAIPAARSDFPVVRFRETIAYWGNASTGRFIHFDGKFLQKNPSRRAGLKQRCRMGRAYFFGTLATISFWEIFPSFFTSAFISTLGLPW